ncbi:GNAT family N-acetyltransferase [Pseudaestuariivita rosea]|uniref:GNAT family N-acetyltransferase n=1 Tax=Pseudaestuariivita rosea TaxID=2763263 RepID=UPI001ABB0A96|nr:GNAT family N-acetyltransferase [Pseudaestuariivita rosea]
MDQDIEIKKLGPEPLGECLGDLADVLHATVQQGAAVSFLLPHGVQDSRAFWQWDVFPDVARGNRVIWAAMVGARAVGTVQLITRLPENQPHRCEVAKLLVHPEFRQLGLARKLMHALENEARVLGKHLITLDTRTEDLAEPFYQKLGYQVAGVIPDFGLDADRSGYHATTYMYKILSR